MSTHERPSAEELRNALNETGLNLSDDEVRQLADEQDVALEDRHGGGEGHADATPRPGRCPGILIYRISAFCGLYLLLGPPPRLRVCCNFIR